MGGTPHWRRGHLAWLQAAARTSAAERGRCAAVVERWNAAPTHDWSPAIGTALKAGYRWLDVYCGGCRQVKPIDLAAVDVHPQACLTSLILMLHCRQCGGYGPLPQLIGVARQMPDRGVDALNSLPVSSRSGRRIPRPWRNLLFLQGPISVGVTRPAGVGGSSALADASSA
jgi:hypothetical protein